MKLVQNIWTKSKRDDIYQYMTVIKHQIWFSIKCASAHMLQPDYNRPEGAGL